MTSHPGIRLGLSLFPAFLVASVFAAPAGPATSPSPPPVIVCKGPFRGHLQGVAANPARTVFYWSFTRHLVKTDAAGKILLKKDVPSHHGDLAWHAGKLYVAVNFGAFNQPAGKADSWVYVYADDDLRLVAKHPVPEVVHGAGGMACDGRRFVIVGGLPKGIKENYVYEYDLELHFVKRHVLPSGYTNLGIQAAAYDGRDWWFGCYPRTLLKTDGSFHLTGTYPVGASYGLVPMANGLFLVAQHIPPKWSARLIPFRVDEKAGLKPLDSRP